ncbi:cytochrome P450 [Streptomyces sp. NBC_00820]|uniref:hypothetical protein n=1 Tax=Streptomyces sp. NBC_00820 TaxID=2975842 RepID=UPI002ED41509|nr:cytochrome P450 [Streptomyces sp. NBC_00820]WTI18095.1 cytochrome P450 [Streptomyces sp. NBC_00820]
MSTCTAERVGLVTLVCDCDDNATWPRSVLAASHPATGHIAVDTVPGSSARMARDILRALDVTGHRATASPKLATEPAWRAVTCWMDILEIRQLTVLRAHLLTPPRVRRLARLREGTGISLFLLAHCATEHAAQRLHALLKSNGLAPDPPSLAPMLTRPALPLLPAPVPRPAAPPPDRFAQLPALTELSECSFTRFRAEAHRRLEADGFACVDAQYLAGLYAARTHCARSPQPMTQQDLEFFLARLTATSPSRAHTLARLRGAQVGFLTRGLLLHVPGDLDRASGPGLTTCPVTPYVLHQVSRGIAHPVQLAAILALLFTGTHPDALRATPLSGLDARCTHLTVPDVWHPGHGSPSEPPGVCYTIPPRARPVFAAASAFRRMGGARDHFPLFELSFGHLLEALAQDAALPMPALTHPHYGPDWHHRAHCHQLTDGSPPSGHRPPPHRTLPPRLPGPPPNPHTLSPSERATLLAHADDTAPDDLTLGQAALLAAAISGHLTTTPGCAPLSASALAELTERRLLDARSTAPIPVLHPDLRFALALSTRCARARSSA